MKKLLSVILVAVLSFLGLVSLVKADEPAATVPSASDTSSSSDSEPATEKTVTFKVEGKADQVIKVTAEKRLESQPVAEPAEGKVFKGWKLEGSEDSTASELPETFEQSATYVAVFADKVVAPAEEKTVTFKVEGKADQVIKVTAEKRLESQPVAEPAEGKVFKGWKLEGSEDSTASELPETFEQSATYVAVFADKAAEPTVPGTNPEKPKDPKDPKEGQGSTSTDANDKKANKNSAALVAVPVIAIVVLGAAGAAFVVIKRRK